MARPVELTAAAVSAAFDAVIASGKPATKTSVWKIAGGAPKYFEPLYEAEVSRRQAAADQAITLPEAFEELGAASGIKLATEIYSRVVTETNVRIIESEARSEEKVKYVEAALEDARKEIKALKDEMDVAKNAHINATRVADEATIRATHSEGRIQELRSTIEHQTALIAATQDAERQAIVEASRLQGQLAAMEKLLASRNDR